MGGLPPFANRTVHHRSFQGRLMMHSHRTPLLRTAAALVAAAVLAACDAPTDPAERAAAGGPSLLITPACAGTGGQTHATNVTTAQTWTRANSPHRVTGIVAVEGGVQLTIAAGAVVCFEPGTSLQVRGGSRLWARGRDTAQIVFTARDPARGWDGIAFYGTSFAPSYLTNVRVELVNVDQVAVSTAQQHPVFVDSAVIRQNGSAVSFGSAGSRLIRSRVDTTTNRTRPAVGLTAGGFEHSVVRGAAETGVLVNGEGVLLLGGRIEGSGDVGLQVWADSLSSYSRAVRVVGGKSYAARLPLPSLVRLYPTPGLQDSLVGNARDEVALHGGTVRSALTIGPRIQLRVRAGVDVDSGGSVTLQPGARMIFGASTWMTAQNGGRVWSRGTAASPVLLTADDPGLGWAGLTFRGSVPTTSYVTNTRIEHVRLTFGSVAVAARDNHRVIVDSSVIRQSGRAVVLESPNSRLMRTRVDTMLDSRYPAVELRSNARIESTRIRASAGPGLLLGSSSVHVASCEVIDGDGDAILMDSGAVTVRNCNLVNNLGVGIRNLASSSATATGNWWGSVGGPTGPGGDGVSGPVVYSPWRTTPFVLPYVP
jgi:hypothetical protein